ncbi:MAG: alpha/beta hydrolase [Clostridia bacterium]|nr:alpha/beta hydrolase [Clostridia bacterium]
MTKERRKQFAREFGKHTLDADARAKAEGAFIDLPSGNTHYELRGEGELCVLVHGYAVPYFLYDKVADALVENGYWVLRYDLLGRGLSERVRRRYTPALFARQLGELLDALAGDEKVNLFATSMGGPVVTAFCAAHPERVNKLIFYAPAGMDTFKPPFYMYLTACPLIGDILFAVCGDKILFKNCAREIKLPQDEVDAYLEKLAVSLNYKGFCRCALSSLRNTILKTKKATGFFKETAAQGIPTLCLWGTADITMPFYMSERFREVMPQAEFHALEGAGHIFIYDEIENTMQYTLPFLAED